MQFLDTERMAVGAMHNRWFDVQGGQRLTQGLSVAAGIERYATRCASCHGAPDGDAHEALELADPDLITGASLTLSRYELQNPRRPLAPAETGSASRIEIDYRSDVQPILDARCATAACHAGGKPAAGLALSGAPTTWYWESYEALLEPARKLVDKGHASARRSHLIERLSGRELDAERALPVPLAHPKELGAAPVNQDELLVMIRWIELGASFRGRTSP
jgi:hypothetical protein